MRHLSVAFLAALLLAGAPVSVKSDALGVTIHLETDRGPHFVGTPITLHVTITNTSDTDGSVYAVFTWLDRNTDGSTTRDIGIRVITRTPRPSPIAAGTSLRFDLQREACARPVPCKMHFAVEYSGSLQARRSWTAESNDIEIVAERDPTATFLGEPDGDRAIVSVTDEEPVSFPTGSVRLRFSVPAGSDFGIALASNAKAQLLDGILSSGTAQLDDRSFVTIDVRPQNIEQLRRIGRGIASATDPTVTFEEATPEPACDAVRDALDANVRDTGRRATRLAQFLDTETDRQDGGVAFRIDRPPDAYQAYCFGSFPADTIRVGTTYPALVSTRAHFARSVTAPAILETAEMDAFTTASSHFFQATLTPIGDRPELLVYTSSATDTAEAGGYDFDAFALRGAARYASIAANALHLTLEHPSLIALLPNEASGVRNIALAEMFVPPASRRASASSTTEPPPPTPAHGPPPHDLTFVSALSPDPIVIPGDERTVTVRGVASAELRRAVDDPCVDAITRATRDAAYAANAHVRQYEMQRWFDGANLVLVTANAPLASPVACTATSANTTPHGERVTVTLDLTYRLL